MSPSRLHFTLLCANLIFLLALTSFAATTAPPASGKKTYIVALKEPAQPVARAELKLGHSPVADYLRQQPQLAVPPGDALHFLNMFIVELDDTEYAALFNREWVDTEIQDAHGRVLQRHTRPAGQALRKAEIDALSASAPGAQVVHHYRHLTAIAADSGSVQLCAVWPTNNFPSRPNAAYPTNYQSVGNGLQRMNVGGTNGFVPWATSPFPMPCINGQFKPLCYPGTTNRIGVAVLDSGIDAYTVAPEYSANDYPPTNVVLIHTNLSKHPDLEEIPAVPHNSYYYNPSNSIPNLGGHSFQSFDFDFSDPWTGDVRYLPEYVDCGDGSGHGHGTAVASIIAAQDNGFGIVGIAPGVQIWNVRCIWSTLPTYPPPLSGTSWSYVLLGMNFVLAHADEIAVANMSFINSGSPMDTSLLNLLHTAIQKLVQAGVVLVGAAGNDKIDIRGADGIYGTGDDKVPAAFSEVISVSGMNPKSNTLYGWDTNHLTADGSNYGPVARPAPLSGLSVYTGPGQGIDLCAPAMNVAVAASLDQFDEVGDPFYENRTQSYANGVVGTSFAAPHVAGLVALYIAANGRATNEAGVYAIRKAIMQESERLQPQSDWGVANTFDPDNAHEALAFPSEAWVPSPTPSWSFNRASNTLHAAVIATNANVAATVRGYDYKLIYQDALGGPVWSNYPGASQPGTGFPLDLGTVSTLETRNRFFSIQRTPRPVP